MKFNLKAKWGKARAGVMTLPHGVVETPIFMPVGTKASVKSLTPEDLETLNAQIILGNTYHLYLRPGDELIHQFGGLHGFMKWDKPILTDSGGFQVSSLGSFRSPTQDAKTIKLKHPKIDENGVTFWSHLDGSQHLFTAEKSIEIQKNLGADIIMAFDEATPDKGRDYAIEAMNRTHAWLDRSVDHWQKLENQKQTTGQLPQSLFGIIQGGIYEELRRESAKYILEKDLPGVAIGGGSIGANRELTSQQVAWIYDLLPQGKPLYLMGVGVNPEDLISAILDGADMFDCVAPTRLARTGILYAGELVTKLDPSQDYVYQLDFETSPKIHYVSQFKRGRLLISQTRFKHDPLPISQTCGCYTCKNEFSRAYLRHLISSKELLYYRLASIHNLYQMIQIVSQMRQYILDFGDSL